MKNGLVVRKEAEDIADLELKLFVGCLSQLVPVARGTGASGLYEELAI